MSRYGLAAPRAGSTCAQARNDACYNRLKQCDSRGALHGSMFDLDTGQPDSLPALEPIPVYTAVIDEGDIYVDVAAQKNDAAKPAFDSAG